MVVLGGCALYYERGNPVRRARGQGEAAGVEAEDMVGMPRKVCVGVVVWIVYRQVFQVPQILHFEPSLDALS